MVLVGYIYIYVAPSSTFETSPTVGIFEPPAESPQPHPEHHDAPVPPVPHASLPPGPLALERSLLQEKPFNKEDEQLVDIKKGRCSHLCQGEKKLHVLFYCGSGILGPLQKNSSFATGILGSGGRCKMLPVSILTQIPKR